VRSVVEELLSTVVHRYRPGGRRVHQIWANAISFLWGYLKSQVYQHRPRTLETLNKVITQEVAAIQHEMTRMVIDNYRERFNQCIENEGRHLSDVIFKNS